MKKTFSTDTAGAAATSERPSREEAEAAVRTLIRWAGDDPRARDLVDTPARVVRSYEEFFSGYADDPTQILARTFSEVEGYDEMIVLNDIRFESHREHHMVPVIGRAHVAICRRTGWSASPSWRASWKSMPNGCRSRRR